VCYREKRRARYRWTTKTVTPRDARKTQEFDMAAIRLVLAGCAAALALSGCAPRATTPAGIKTVADDCGAPAIALHDIQGATTRSALVGQPVEVEGVVTRAFVGLGGFFIEAPASARDRDPATSEGLFVVPPADGERVNAGARIRVAGRVTEDGDARASVTTLHATRVWSSCTGDAILPAPIAITAPLTDAQREALEGMRIVIAGSAVLTDTYSMIARGTLRVALGGRIFEPSEHARPGPERAALAQANREREFLLDGSATESFAPLWFLGGAPSDDAPWRTGTRIAGIDGVFDQRDGAYRVQLAAPLTAVEQAPRPPSPKRGAALRVASFNVFNLFNGDGIGGGFPTARGATDAAEYARQRYKIALAIAAVAPDIVALMEVENDGEGEHAALVDLVAEINGLLGGGGDYTIARAGVDRLGGDLIKVALIYRRATIATQGEAAYRLDGAFAAQNRAPLAQRFVLRSGGEPFIVVANHFKSKGGCKPEAPAGDQDNGEGNACWNATRVGAARDLVAWLATDPTHAGADVDTLIVGDLNAYGAEDPIQVLRDAGYVDVVARALGDTAYSFVYNGHVGRLDHALANAGMAARVAGVAEWHINADELERFDFNREGKSEAELLLGDRMPFRSSDHDPLLIELRH
jgi:uncharacterized protein